MSSPHSRAAADPQSFVLLKRSWLYLLLDDELSNRKYSLSIQFLDELGTESSLSFPLREALSSTLIMFHLRDNNLGVMFHGGR